MPAVATRIGPTNAASTLGLQQSDVIQSSSRVNLLANSAPETMGAAPVGMMNHPASASVFASPSQPVKNPRTRRARCLARLREPLAPEDSFHRQDMTSDAPSSAIARDSRVIACLLRSNAPFMVGRPSLGPEAIVAHGSLLRERIGTGYHRELKRVAGVNAPTEASASDFGAAYLQALNHSDLMVRWNHDSPKWKTKRGTHPTLVKHDAIFTATTHLPGRCINNEVLEPFLVWLATGSSWTSELVGKTVLVVSAFAETIGAQLQRNASEIWGESMGADAAMMLPLGVIWKTLRPPMNIAGGNETQGDWQADLASLIARVDAAGPFDVALLSCGGLGMLLSLHLRRTRRSSIYVGGPLQLHFGVRGKRWDNMPEYRRAQRGVNWVRPSASLRPKNFAKDKDAQHFFRL